ncbi:MAG: peptidoglycan DD-metalloendopeptidase family protein [candidate division KSB1 bacterium]|nr:peptidoglycan DD-metalloendopeptidase family protein [candidate division KSB1 bacterium]MDZ7366254.1 peptidoglycan DD-metalloendopeptidase family protein [candidate division KSB1 bacterium]MDZ7404472.1 peptidoglycan DD-metalloendopeptidase family protein [candidate division KSB1 bacterium]
MTDPAAVHRAITFNEQEGRLLGWRTLRDQIEVNILGCPRANAQLAPADFAQAVALFQRNQGLSVDGVLGTNTWTRMKAIQAERDPVPRAPISQDYNATPNIHWSDGYVHPAIDVPLAGGTALPAVADGIVIYAGIAGKIRRCDIVDVCRGLDPNRPWTAGTCMYLHYGRTVIIEHPDRVPGMQPGGQSVYTIYAHVQFTPTRQVTAGERVRAGRIIAEVGTGCVGNSNGPHLHYAIAVGPRSYRFRGGRPSRCELFTDAFCRRPDSQCSRCDFTHFWNVVTPRRPRTTAAGAGFRW